MKKVLTIMVVAVALLMTGVQANAQNKMGFVSMQELYSILPEAKKADSTLNAYKEVLQKAGQDYQEELQTRAEKFYADSAKMTTAVKEVERQKLQDLYGRTISYQEEAQKKLQTRQQELIAPLQKNITAMISQVAKENGYTHVFERDVAIVMPEADNLLPMIRKKMNLK